MEGGKRNDSEDRLLRRRERRFAPGTLQLLTNLAPFVRLLQGPAKVRYTKIAGL